MIIPTSPDRLRNVSYGDDFNHGWVASYELGYQEPNKNYSGVYKLGINANNLAVYSNPNTGETYRGDFTAYGLAEKTVYHPTDATGKLESKKGLDVLLEFLGAPGDRNNLEFEFTAGARYTGLIPGRDQDKTGLGIVYSQNGSAASERLRRRSRSRCLAGRPPLELDYQINPLSWFSFQLDDQYIIDPGGDAQRSRDHHAGIAHHFSFLNSQENSINQNYGECLISRNLSEQRQC